MRCYKVFIKFCPSILFHNNQGNTLSGCVFFQRFHSQTIIHNNSNHLIRKKGRPHNISTWNYRSFYCFTLFIVPVVYHAIGYQKNLPFLIFTDIMKRLSCFQDHFFLFIIRINPSHGILSKSPFIGYRPIQHCMVHSRANRKSVFHRNRKCVSFSQWPEIKPGFFIIFRQQAQPVSC